jgi:hypothetical protein
MTRLHKIKIYWLALLAISFVWISCEDDVEKDMEAPRIFRPTSFESSVSGVNATLTWNAIPGAISYTVEVSTDSLDYSSPIFAETTEDRLLQLFDLQGGVNYFARIKSNAEKSSMDSYFAEVVIEVPEENLFNGFFSQNGIIGEKTVELVWFGGSKVTHVAFNNGSESTEFQISEAEAEVGLKTDIVLPDNNVVYEVLLMNGENVRGKLNLRVEGDVFLYEGDDLASAIMGATDGDIVVLQGNATFVHQGSWAVEGGKSLTFLGGPGLSKAVFAFNGTSGSTGINQPSEGVDYIKFVNIELTGAPSGDMEAESSTWLPHFINKNGDGEISKLIFDNCIISKFDRNLVRFRSTSRMDSLIINNSIVDFSGGKGDYHIVVSENDSYINDIVFSNSTFYGSKRGLVRNNSNVTQNSFVLEYSTVNNMVDNGRYLIEMKSPITNVIFRNSILGRTIGQYDAATSSGGIYGASVVEGFTFSSPGSYALADFSQNLNSTMVDRKIDIQSYGKTAEEVFVNPDEMDFRIKDSGFGGRGVAGDPRWW